MTEKRKRGRPKGAAKFTIQKHVFLDQETAEMLRDLASREVHDTYSESATIRHLIRQEYDRVFANT